MKPPRRRAAPAKAGAGASAAVALAPATVSEADGVRYLHLDSIWVQGAMRLARPDALELEYVQRMTGWMLLRPSAAVTEGHAVQLGLGAAALTRFCHGVLRMRTTAVELNPSVVEACRLFFRLPADSERLQVLLGDAAEYVADPNLRGSADVLCVDLYDQEAASPVLDSAEFYAACCSLLAPAGVMAVNLFGRDASFERSVERIAAAFGADRVVEMTPTREGNTIVLALKSDTLPDRAELVRRAENIETRFGLPARKWLRLLRPPPGLAHPPDRPHAA